MIYKETIKEIKGVRKTLKGGVLLTLYKGAQKDSNQHLRKFFKTGGYE
jgi:hypothetical protein